MTSATAPVATSAPATDAPRWLPAAVLTVLVLWASAFIAIRAVADDLEPGPLALGRLLVGTVVLAPLALRRRLRLPRGRGLALVVVYGVLWFAGYTVVLNAAEHHLDAGTAAMLVNVAPLLVAAVAGLALREGYPRALLVGLAVGFGGVVLIAVSTSSGGTSPLGIGLGLLAAVLYAVGVLTQKAALRTVDAVTATWLGCLVGALVLLPYAPQLVAQAGEASAGALGAVVYLGAFPTAVAFLLWAAVLRRAGAGRTASATLAVPAIVVVMSWALLGEVPGLLTMVGGALALLGVAISRRAPRRA